MYCCLTCFEFNLDRKNVCQLCESNFWPTIHLSAHMRLESYNDEWIISTKGKYKEHDDAWPNKG